MVALVLAVDRIAPLNDRPLDVDFAKTSTLAWRPISTWKVAEGEDQQIDSGYDIVAVADQPVDGVRQDIAIRVVTGNHGTWVVDSWARGSFRTVKR